MNRIINYCARILTIGYAAASLGCASSGYDTLRSARNNPTILPQVEIPADYKNDLEAQIEKEEQEAAKKDYSKVVFVKKETDAVKIRREEDGLFVARIEDLFFRDKRPEQLAIRLESAGYKPIKEGSKGFNRYFAMADRTTEGECYDQSVKKSSGNIKPIVQVEGEKGNVEAKVGVAIDYSNGKDFWENVKTGGNSFLLGLTRPLQPYNTIVNSNGEEKKVWMPFFRFVKYPELSVRRGLFVEGQYAEGQRAETIGADTLLGALIIGVASGLGGGSSGGSSRDRDSREIILPESNQNNNQGKDNDSDIPTIPPVTQPTEPAQPPVIPDVEPPSQPDKPAQPPAIPGVSN